VAILSNSVGSCDDINYKGAERLERHLSLPIIRHKNKKPDCLSDVCKFVFTFNIFSYLYFFKVLNHFTERSGKEIFPHEICIIGANSYQNQYFLVLHQHVALCDDTRRPRDDRYPVRKLTRNADYSCRSTDCNT